MPKARLIEARWMRPHRGRKVVQLRYADGSRRLVGLSGTLTVGEAAKLLNIRELQIYRKANRGELAIRNGTGYARIAVSALAAL
jgi:excisionase family DNA binding protein